MEMEAGVGADTHRIPTLTRDIRARMTKTAPIGAGAKAGFLMITMNRGVGAVTFCTSYSKLSFRIFTSDLSKIYL